MTESAIWIPTCAAVLMLVSERLHGECVQCTPMPIEPPDINWCRDPIKPCDAHLCKYAHQDLPACASAASLPWHTANVMHIPNNTPDCM